MHKGCMQTRCKRRLPVFTRQSPPDNWGDKADRYEHATRNSAFWAVGEKGRRRTGGIQGRWDKCERQTFSR